MSNAVVRPPTPPKAPIAVSPRPPTPIAPAVRPVSMVVPKRPSTLPQPAVAAAPKPQVIEPEPPEPETAPALEEDIPTKVGDRAAASAATKPLDVREVEAIVKAAVEEAVAPLLRALRELDARIQRVDARVHAPPPVAVAVAPSPAVLAPAASPAPAAAPAPARAPAMVAARPAATAFPSEIPDAPLSFGELALFDGRRRRRRLLFAAVAAFVVAIAVPLAMTIASYSR